MENSVLGYRNNMENVGMCSRSGTWQGAGRCLLSQVGTESQSRRPALPYQVSRHSPQSHTPPSLPPSLPPSQNVDRLLYLFSAERQRVWGRRGKLEATQSTRITSLPPPGAANLFPSSILSQFLIHGCPRAPGYTHLDYLCSDLWCHLGVLTLRYSRFCLAAGWEAKGIGWLIEDSTVALHSPLRKHPGD
jgi:hypothetical protein